jgi:uncharacterized protein (TIGR04255 family)
VGLHLSGGTLLERYVTMFRLEEPPQYRLARPPLNQVLVEVRFPVETRLASVEGVAPLQQHLATLFPYLRQQQVQQLTMRVSADAPVAGETQITRPWIFTDDTGWTFRLEPGIAALSIGPQYSAFDEFSDRFSTIATALRNITGVQRADRLGVRYLNVAEVPPGDGGDWRQWFRSELTGWSATDIVRDSRVITSLTQTQLTAPPVQELKGPPADVQAIIRHGVVPENTFIPGAVPPQLQRASYLMDLDVFVEASQPFDPEELSRQVTVFHDQIDRFFYWAMTDDGKMYFGCEVETDDANAL